MTHDHNCLPPSTTLRFMLPSSPPPSRRLTADHTRSLHLISLSHHDMRGKVPVETLPYYHTCTCMYVPDPLLCRKGATKEQQRSNKGATKEPQKSRKGATKELQRSYKGATNKPQISHKFPSTIYIYLFIYTLIKSFPQWG